MNPSIENTIIDKYAEKLREIYDKQTAGDYTFEGVLSLFLKDVDKARVELQNQKVIR